MPSKKAPRTRLNDGMRQEKTSSRGSRKAPAHRANSLQEAEEWRQHSPYEQWSKHDLYEKAIEEGIEGRARMSKRDLINTLRDY